MFDKKLNSIAFCVCQIHEEYIKFSCTNINGYGIIWSSGNMHSNNFSQNTNNFFLKRTDSDKIYSQLFDVSFWGPAIIRIVR